MEQHDILHVVSDLHLGGEPGRQIFDQGELLGETIAMLAAEAPAERVALVLNGDIVDFLAASGAVYLDRFGAPVKLQKIISDPAFAPVWKALARFIRVERRTLVLALGNHDVELALPDVQDHLLAELTQGDAAARGRIRIAMDGTGYACKVGGRRTLCLHGNEVDPWNVVDPTALHKVIRGLRQGSEVPEMEPCAGTRLVIDVMNDVKRAHPLVDLLKPETRPLLGVLLALDPSQLGAIRHLSPIAVRLVYDRARQRGGMLAGDAQGAPPEDLGEDAALALLLAGPRGARKVATEEELFEEADRLHREGRDPLDLEGGGVLGFRNIFAQAVRGRDVSSELRESLLEWLAEDKSFAIDEQDDTCRALDARVGSEVEVLIAGHTHLARAVRRKHGRGRYFNSGTWARLIRITEEMLRDDRSFAPVLAAFRGRSLDALDQAQDLVLRRPTVVSLDAASGVLHHAELKGGHATLVPVPGSRLS